MTINEFGGSDGENEIRTGPEGRDSAAMVLHEAAARYNIATYQFASTDLTTLSTLKYTVYDASASSQTPFLNFNVSFDGNDNWQRRLVHVPGASTNDGVPVNTWTEVDAIDGGDAMWTWSYYAGNGNVWPAQPGANLPDPNAQYQKWSDLVAAYPSLQILDTDSFFGVRVGHPGPDAEESYVDSIEFNGTVYDFVN
jgi:hypothetical protein